MKLFVGMGENRARRRVTLAREGAAGDDHRARELGVRHDEGVDVEDLGEQRRREHLCRATDGVQATRSHDGDARPVLRGEVQIVQDAHDGAAVVGHPPREPQHRVLMREVEARGRLVEEQGPG